MTALKPIASTRLYAPAGGEQFVFLLWPRPPDRPPKSIPLADTWADEGLPARVGYHVFVDAVPTAADAAAALVKELQRLPPPETTGFAWVITSPAYELLGVAPMKLDDTKAPVVAADSPITMTPPLPDLTIPAGLWPVAGSGEPLGWVLTEPRPPDPAGAAGLSVALLGPASGCIAFQGLLQGSATGSSSVKQLAAVTVDPRFPFDPSRTSITPLGEDYLLSVDAAGAYSLAPLT